MNTGRKRMTRPAAALCMCLILGLCACGGGSGSSGGDKLLESEFSDAGNWTAYETYDQLTSTAAAATANALTVGRAADRDNIVTYTANGLVSEFFNYLAATSDTVAMGSRQYGVSMLRFEDLDAPRGKVYNYRKNGLNGLADHHDHFYVWFYDGSIIDITTGTTVYNNAPMGTQTGYGPDPKNRLVIQDGNFFIGTSNLDADGNVPTDLESDMNNGLWQIAADFSGSTKVIDHPVWCLYKDSVDTIWAGTRDGIYRQNNDVFENVHGGYAEQVFEFDGEVYALIKDFFHKPGDTTDFDLYRWDEDGNTFDYVCEASSLYGTTGVDALYAFVWDETLYASGDQTSLLVFDGSTFSLQNKPIYDDIMGQYCVLVAHEKLFSVGNLTGLNIWDGVDYTQLNTVNTAEGLLSNDIDLLHVNSNGDLWIGSPVSGFNVLDQDGIFESYELAGEIEMSGIFEHGGTTYVQGATAVYEADYFDVQLHANFACNGEKVYYDASRVRLWAFPNFSDIHNGALGMLDMDTLEIWGTTAHNDKAEYWQRDYEWEKPPYHFNDVIAIPDEDAVFIALANGNGRVLKYDYQSDTFSEVGIPIDAISYFDSTSKAVFGVGGGSIVKYEKGAWSIVIDGLLSEYPVGLLVQHQYAFVPTSFNLEVVQLASGKTSEWNFDELPIEGQLQTIAMRSNRNPGVTTKAYAVIFGTGAGVVICNLNLN